MGGVSSSEGLRHTHAMSQSRRVSSDGLRWSSRVDAASTDSKVQMWEQTRNGAGSKGGRGSVDQMQAAWHVWTVINEQ